MGNSKPHLSGSADQGEVYIGFGDEDGGRWFFDFENSIDCTRDLFKRIAMAKDRCLEIVVRRQIEAFLEAHFAFKIARFGGRRGEHTNPAVPLANHRADGVPAERSVIEVNRGQCDSLVACSGNDTGNATRLEPFLHRFGGLLEDPADGLMATVKECEVGTRISPGVLAPVADFKEETRFEEQFPQLIEPDRGGWADLLNRCRGNQADHGPRARWGLNLLRLPDYLGASALNSDKGTLHFQLVDRGSQGTSAHPQSLTKCPFAWEPISPQPLADPLRNIDATCCTRLCLCGIMAADPTTRQER